MRSPACFILRSVWMVTFFKVHLRIVGTVPSASPRAGRRPGGFSAGQLASGYTSPSVKISRVRRGATYTRSPLRAQGLVVLRPGLAASDGAHQVVQVLLALREIDVARVDDEQRGVVPAMEEVVVGARQLGQVLGVEAPLEFPPALLDAREQDLQAGLQIDDQVG